jgi:hypothetical protein
VDKRVRADVVDAKRRRGLRGLRVPHADASALRRHHVLRLCVCVCVRVHAFLYVRRCLRSRRTRTWAPRRRRRAPSTSCSPSQRTPRHDTRTHAHVFTFYACFHVCFRSPALDAARSYACTTHVRHASVQRRGG